MHIMPLRLSRVSSSTVARRGGGEAGDGPASPVAGSLLWAVLLSAALAAGCSKEPPAAAPAAAAPAAPPSAKSAVIPDSGDVNATLNQLTLELRRYVVGTRSVPKDFEDFAAKSRVQAPPPPAGKKYAIKDQAVVLVNR